MLYCTARNITFTRIQETLGVIYSQKFWTGRKKTKSHTLSDLRYHVCWRPRFSTTQLMKFLVEMKKWVYVLVSDRKRHTWISCTDGSKISIFFFPWMLLCIKSIAMESYSSGLLGSLLCSCVVPVQNQTHIKKIVAVFHSEMDRSSPSGNKGILYIPRSTCRQAMSLKWTEIK